MESEEFERLAAAIFADLPSEFREGIDGLEVSRETMPHPDLPGIYTLGECRTENFPSDYGGVGEVRSIIVLFYGSFIALSRLDDEWDWEGEIWETVTHEVRHHLESLAADDALERTDYAEDQNFARREGDPFDAFFYRHGTAVGPSAWHVDGDVFVEVIIGALPAAPLVRWGGKEYPARVPDPLGDVHLVRLADLEEGGELVAVLLRRVSFREKLASIFARRALDVRQTGWAE